MGQTLIHLGALVIVLLGFVLRLYNLAHESLWYDELLQLDIAQQTLPELLYALPFHAAVPLDYLVTHFWIALGQDDYWVRFPAAALGTLTLPVAYQLGRRLLTAPAGLLFMALLAFSPFHIWHSQEVRPYALVMLGVTLAGYAFWRLRATGRWRYFMPLQVGVLLFSLGHFFAVVVLGPWLLFAVLDFFTNSHRPRPGRALSGLLISGLVALMVLLSLGWGATFVNISSRFSEAISNPQQFTPTTEETPNLSSGPIIDWNFVRDQILAPLGAGGADTTLQLFNGLAVLGLLYLLLRKRFKLSLLLGGWLFLPIVVIVAFLMHRGEFFAPRYIISVLPAYLLLVTVGLLALPYWLKCAEPGWLSTAALLILTSFVVVNYARSLGDYYLIAEKEDWRLVTRFISQNAGPNDLVIAVNAESTLNWYYPQATAAANTYDDLENIQAAVTEAERSWVIMSIFAAYLGEREDVIKAWLSEIGAVRLDLDPLIAVYYVGPNAPPEQLLEEIQTFALPADHALYASLARENRRRPAVARQYLELAIQHAPDNETRAQYEADLTSLLR